MGYVMESWAEGSPRERWSVASDPAQWNEIPTSLNLPALVLFDQDNEVKFGSGVVVGAVDEHGLYQSIQTDPRAVWDGLREETREYLLNHADGTLPAPVVTDLVRAGEVVGGSWFVGIDDGPGFELPEDLEVFVAAIR